MFVLWAVDYDTSHQQSFSLASDVSWGASSRSVLTLLDDTVLDLSDRAQNQVLMGRKALAPGG